jgi:hypothetical protein
LIIQISSMENPMPARRVALQRLDPAIKDYKQARNLNHMHASSAA